MSNLLKEGSRWLESMREKHCSSPVAYVRGAIEHEVAATFGETEYDVADDYGATIRTHVTDFLVLADALGLEPKPGDQILSNSRKYEVMNLSGEGCWRWSDPYHATYRIHAKKVCDT